MPEPASKKRIVGLALLASTAILVVMAILFGTGVFPVPDESRMLVAGAFVVAAVLDGFMAIRYLVSSDE